ncbi:protein eva-1 homolog A isoform X4 [Ursus arctos]|uniref:protein eva-1 homolog A isoform X4 n=1 Tax=Ursus arctos TaxID=9644 RepID=UPI002546DFD8|nr:protein eva-1 homolog A isoform X4 [Ursus arctos]
MGNLPGPWKGLEAPGGRQELESVNKLGVEGGATRRSRSEPEKPTGANQVSEPLLLETNITRDELFLPDNPLFLTAHLSPEEKRGRCHLDPAEAFSGGFLWMPRRGRPSAIARNW